MIHKPNKDNLLLAACEALQALRAVSDEDDALYLKQIAEPLMEEGGYTYCTDCGCVCERWESEEYEELCYSCAEGESQDRETINDLMGVR